MLDETLIIFLSDHGDMTGDHWLWRKSYAYEPSARIPMLVRGPGAARGTVNTTPVEIRDVLPTLASAAGVSVPGLCDGQNVLTARRDWIDLEHNICYDAVNHWTALTDGKWKYVYHAFDGSEQLFDLTRDPYELTDLSGDTASTPALRQWRSRMAAHLEPRGPEWTKNGVPVPRPKSMPFSPNYPAQA
jgi:arylsulfatase A-like enzyme